QELRHRADGPGRGWLPGVDRGVAPAAARPLPGGARPLRADRRGLALRPLAGRRLGGFLAGDVSGGRRRAVYLDRRQEHILALRLRDGHLRPLRSLAGAAAGGRRRGAARAWGRRPVAGAPAAAARHHAPARALDRPPAGLFLARAHAASLVVRTVLLS